MTPPGLQNHDPLAVALRHKARTGGAGATGQRLVAAGDGWKVVDIVCTAGPHDRPYEERQPSVAISLVLGGTFTYRNGGGSALLSTGSWLLVDHEQPFECSHRHGEGDRCLSFQFEPALFERLACDAGARHAGFALSRLPPLRRVAPLAARAAAALERPDSFEEIALEVIGAMTALTGGARAPVDRSHGGAGRIAPVLRHMEAQLDAPHPLAELARSTELSPYHFLRVFKGVTGVTPHQWLLRARLRRAARLLATTRAAVTDVALDVGFDDLSNFIRTFRAEFGTSPRRYRDAHP